MTEQRLGNYLSIKKEMKGIERRIEELEAEVYGVKSLSISQAGVKTHCGVKHLSTADFSEKLVKLIDLKKIYEQKWDKLIDERTAVEAAIEEFPPLYRAIFRARYIDGMTWNAVAGEVGYSHRQLMRLVKAWWCGFNGYKKNTL